MASQGIGTAVRGPAELKSARDTQLLVLRGKILGFYQVRAVLRQVHWKGRQRGKGFSGVQATFSESEGKPGHERTEGSSSLPGNYGCYSSILH